MLRSRSELAFSFTLDAQWRLKELQSGPRAQEIAQARARLDAAKSNVVTQELELERQEKLVQANYTTERDVDIIENRLQAAQANQREAEQALDLAAGMTLQVELPAL